MLKSLVVIAALAFAAPGLAVADDNNDGCTTADKIGGKRRQPIELRLRIAVLDRDIAALDEALRIERLAERRQD